MFDGLRAAGIMTAIREPHDYKGRPSSDFAAFYGLSNGLHRIFRDYAEINRLFFADLGYWHRRKRTRWDGYHKVVLNARHPTVYFNTKPRDPSRFASLGVEIKPWRKSGSHIIVAGMSGKAAAMEGLQPEQWERQTIAALRKLTRRKIIYRPKPNWMGARPIPGSVLDKMTALELAFEDCHAIVTHHSNVAVDALMAGIPCICPGGVASLLSSHDLADIENPLMPDGREQWACNLAWTQWSLEEMRNGAMWEYFRTERILR